MATKRLSHKADEMFEVSGESIECVFEECGKALFGVQADTERLSEKESAGIRIVGESEEKLLYLFLKEILFEAETENLFFRGVAVKIAERNGKWVLNATLQGEERTPEKGRSEVKAITLHEFSLKKEKGKWVARFLLDV